MTVRELIAFLQDFENKGQGSKSVQVVVDLKPAESHMLVGHVVCALETEASPDSVILVTQSQVENVVQMSSEYRQVN